MKKISFALFTLLLAACGPEPLQITVANAEPQFYYKVEIQEGPGQDFSLIHYKVSDTLSLHESINGTARPRVIFSNSRVLNGTFLNEAAGQLLLLAGFSPDRTLPTLVLEPLLGFVFWSGQPFITKEWVDEFFFVGRSFPIGWGANRVNLMMRLPSDGFATTAAQSFFLNNPTGELVITAVEDYAYESRNLTPIRGKRITCTFEGSIARYDREEHQGSIEDFRTDKALPLRNGEAVFFVAYR